jgi:hypothetical protein
VPAALQPCDFAATILRCSANGAATVVKAFTKPVNIAPSFQVSQRFGLLIGSN